VAQQQEVAISGPATAAGNMSYFGVTTAIANGDTATDIGNKLVANKAAILAGADAKAAGLTDISNNAGTLTLTFTAGPATAPGTGSPATRAAVNAAGTGVAGVSLGAGSITRAGVAGSTAGLAGNASEIAAALNAVSKDTGVVAKVGLAGAYTLTASDGRNITISTPTAGTTGVSAGTTYGSITLKSNSTDGINLGGSQATLAAIGAGAQNISATGAGVNSIDLSTANGAQSALTVLDKAIDTVTNSRAAMGAYQNRLTASISNLETTSMNLQASRSRILDTDYAKETTNLAKSQIITQAATAMLAQANQSAQSVLALLK